MPQADETRGNACYCAVEEMQVQEGVEASYQTIRPGSLDNLKCALFTWICSL